MVIYGYARVSTAKQEDSQNAQEETIERYIKEQMNIGLVPSDAQYGGTYVDSATSGSTKMFERPAGFELFKRLNSGDAIVLTKLDRGFRNTVDACSTIDMLKERGVKIHCLQLGVNPDDPVGRFIYTVIAAFAELERNFIVARINDGMEHAKRHGRAVNRWAPIGWKKLGKARNSRFVPDREEQAMCHKIVTMRHTGLSWKQISNKLRDAGIERKSTGTLWTIASVRKAYDAVLENFPAYNGDDMSKFTVEKRIEKHESTTR